MSDSYVTSWTVARQAPLSMEFSRQEYWSGLPCPPPGNLPDPGIEPRASALQADSLPSESPGKSQDGISISLITYWPAACNLCGKSHLSPPSLVLGLQEWVYKEEAFPYVTVWGQSLPSPPRCGTLTVTCSHSVPQCTPHFVHHLSSPQAYKSSEAPFPRQGSTGRPMAYTRACRLVGDGVRGGSRASDPLCGEAYADSFLVLWEGLAGSV